MKMHDYSRTSMKELAAIIARHLKSKDIEVVLVGGLAVDIYTENRYLTKDIDMVDISYQKPATMQAAMLEIGFKKVGRYYSNETTDIVVEFPSAPLTVGDEHPTELTVAISEFGEIPILFAIDVVKDRLSAFLHWNDQPSLVQALCIMLCNSIEPKNLKAFYEREGSAAHYQQLKNVYKKLKANDAKEMSVIEEYVLSRLIKNA